MKKTFLNILIATGITCAVFGQEPTAQPTNMQFSQITPYSLSMSFSPATASGYLVLKSSQPITDVPVDGTTYQKGQGLTTCKVLSVGGTTSFNVREILEGTNYYFAVFAYNGTGNNIDYLQPNPLVDSVKSTPASEGMYYQNIDSLAGNFISALHTLINAHTMVDYYDYKYNIIPAIYERDTINGQTVINCDYSDSTTIYTAPFDFNGTDYNREHTLCKSWMPPYATYGADVVYYPEGADYFELLLTLATVNDARYNYPEGTVVTLTKAYGKAKYGKDANGQAIFEPQDQKKGDLARAMMYEMVCYNGTDGSWALQSLRDHGPDQSQDILKQWNLQDPPNKWERTKNEYIYSLQHCRNPFIDHPDWANCINFDSLVKTNLCGSAVTAVIDEQMEMQINVFPNPVSNLLNIQLAGSNVNGISVELYDMYGRKIAVHDKTAADSNSNYTISTSGLISGNYLLKIAAGNRSLFKKIMVLN